MLKFDLHLGSSTEAVFDTVKLSIVTKSSNKILSNRHLKKTFFKLDHVFVFPLKVTPIIRPLLIQFPWLPSCVWFISYGVWHWFVHSKDFLVVLIQLPVTFSYLYQSF